MVVDGAAQSGFHRQPAHGLRMHGNIEDLSTKSHTRNPVPCIIAGSKRKELSASLKSLTHVTPALVSLL